MQRIKYLIVPGLVAIGVFFSIELFDTVSNEPEYVEPAAIIDIDGYSEGINTILFDPQGNVDYTLQARRQISYRNSVTELEEPVIQLYRDGDSRWNIAAKSGRISLTPGESDDIEQIDLIGDVEIHQIDDFGNRTVLSTEFLSVDPVHETLKTDFLVNLSSGNLEQSAIGMEIDLTNDAFVFFRK